MKIIEAMKKIKANKEKIADLQNKIGLTCSNLSFETPVYGNDTSAKIKDWLQSCQDLSRDNVNLLCRIAKTNLAVNVTIEIGGKKVEKSIAEWVWRRREYAGIDKNTFSKLGDRGLREGIINSSTGPMESKIVRHFDPIVRDEMIAIYHAEPYMIDGALEVINAVTELLD
jgi:hypothetical protein